jgi:hypothetical protein
MNTAPQIGMFLSMFMTQLPVLVVCLLAGTVVLMKWKQGAQGSIWALCGFGLAVFLCVAVPIVQTAVQHWVTQGDNLAQRASIFGALGIFWSLLRAATYLLLLVAVFAGRSASTAPAS